MLKDNQYKAIELLVDGKLNITQIAKHKDVNVTRRTIYNWMKNETFKKALQEALQLKDDVLRESIKGRAEESLRALEKIRDTSKNDIAKYHASNLLLSYAGWTDKQVTEVNVNHTADESRNKLLDILNSKDKDEDNNQLVN